MKLIVGLGNPGKKYANTRHNIGFRVLDALAQKYKFEFSKSKFQGELAQINHAEHEKIFFLKPQTFMNLSGESVAACTNFYKIAALDVLVIFDDLDLPFSRLRVVQNGSSGGHNGVKSITQHLGTQDFPRLKIGIGRPKFLSQEAKDHVLDVFTKEEISHVEKLVDKAVDCVGIYVDKGIGQAMNGFNATS